MDLQKATKSIVRKQVGKCRVLVRNIINGIVSVCKPSIYDAPPHLC